MKIYKALLLIFLQLSVTVFTQTPSPSNEDEFKKALDFMVQLLKDDRAEVRKTMAETRAKLDSEAADVIRRSEEVKKLADDVEKKAKEVVDRESELLKKKAEIEVKHQEMLKKQEEYKKKYSGVSQAKMRYHHMYRDAIIYQDVIEAMRTGVIQISGSPSGADFTSYTAQNPWHRRPIMRFGIGAQAYPNGWKVNVPEGYNVIWLRCANHVWGTFSLRDSAGTNLGVFACGYRASNEYSPDGGAPDSFHRWHKWIPIRTRIAGLHYIMTGINSDGWVSGIAFGKNLWNHAVNQAVAYHWQLNGGTTTQWETENWNNDVLTRCNLETVCTLIVPVAPSDSDKLLYFSEHNNNWTGTMHKSIKINGREAERLSTSYANPFATHFNSKIYQRYVATKIPKDWIDKSQTFITVELDMRGTNHNFYFRECGTHDFA